MARAQDQDEVIGSVSLTLSGLHFQLVDLDPDDGIDPSVTVLNGFQTQAGARDGDNQRIQTRDGLFPLPFTVISDSSLAQASRTDDGLSLRAEMRASDMANVRHAVPYDELITHAASLTITSTAWSTLSLGPFTQLIVEGQFDPSLSLDMSGLTSHPLWQDPQSKVKSLHGLSSAYLGFSAYDERAQQTVVGSVSTSLFQHAWSGLAGGLERTDKMPPTLSFELSNWTGSPMKGQINLNAVVMVSVGTAVPEPGVLALACSGLSILAWRRCADGGRSCT